MSFPIRANARGSAARRAALALGAVLAACGSGRPTQPSVILISIDTLRADHVGLYGYERDTTPFLDRWSRQALVFEYAFTPCPWTLVAHMTMLTGLYPTQHGVTEEDLALADEIPLLAERLRAAGYQTIGLYHPVWVLPRHGFDRGFDVYRSHSDVEEAERHLQHELERLDPSRPFFLFVHLFDVHQGPILPDRHSIYPAPEPYQEHFQPAATAKLPDYSWKVDPFDTEQVQALTALYDGGIRHLDAKLEQWFTDLERRGLMENTLSIVTADHGENLMDRGRVPGHGGFWMEGIRVPLIVRHPRALRAGERVSENVHLGDIVPTVLETAGLAPDPRLPGCSLFGPLPADRVILGERPPREYVVRGSRKIAHGFVKIVASDFGADPLEKDVAFLPSTEMLDAWRALAAPPGSFPAPRRIAKLTPEEHHALQALGYGGELDDDDDGAPAR